MTRARLAKLGADDAHALHGPLSALGGPGQRTVRHLEVRGVARENATSLRGLREFRDLKSLDIADADHTDLSPLAGLSLTGLTLRSAVGCDLSPLAEMDSLRELALMGISDCRVPDPLRLALDLRALLIVASQAGQQGADVARVIDSLDWARCRNLRTLSIGVWGDSWGPPVFVDLGFVRHLEALWRLDLDGGVWHRGDGPSPLEPPFDGLPRTLRRLTFGAINAAAVDVAVRAHLGLHDPADEVVVFERETPDDAAERVEAGGDWAPFAYDDDDGWGVYGSLCDAWPAFADSVEYEAVQHAERRLHQADPERAASIEFDSESDGTAINAEAREDLVWALEVLGLRAA